MNRNTLQIGFESLRTPTGAFLSSTPIFITATADPMQNRRILEAELEQLTAKAVCDYIRAKKIAKEQTTK